VPSRCSPREGGRPRPGGDRPIENRNDRAVPQRPERGEDIEHLAARENDGKVLLAAAERDAEDQVGMVHDVEVEEAQSTDGLIEQAVRDLLLVAHVTIPDEENVPATASEIAAAPTVHTEIQAALLRLGAEMGYDVWVARNDISRTFGNKQFAEFPRMLSTLPVQFDEATKRTIELIDILWLKGKAIVAAFEVESTTSIYSGLLRMADLVSMQPNINLPLYLVAPDERRDKVFAEVNRPTFAALQPPLAEICRYIGFATLREEIKKVEHVLQYLKPEFLDELSESCELGGE
jgi:hypothetical protein